MERCAISFAHLWQQPELSDVTLVIKAAEDGSDRVLQTLPAHNAILSSSPYFKAQAQRWQDERSGTGTPTVALSLQSEYQLPAAMTVLSVMYGAQEQVEQSTRDFELLQVVLVADMLQVPTITQHAVKQLLEYAGSEHGLWQSTRTDLLQLPALPQCLLDVFPALTRNMPAETALRLWVKSAAPSMPCSLQVLAAAPHAEYMQQRLCEWLGQDLDAQATLAASGTGQLMELSLPAMQLLLASDDLQVSSEDTVLYLAQAYVNAQRTPQQQQAAQAALAPVVRANGLSLFWLTAMLVSPYANKLLLGPYIHQIRRLAPFRQARPDDPAGPAVHKQLWPDAPASWALPRRGMVPRHGSAPHGTAPRRGAKRKKGTEPQHAELYWALPTRQIEDLCKQAARRDRSVLINSERTTPPLQGIVWQLQVVAVWDKADKASTVGLYVVPVNCPHGMFLRYNATITSRDISRALPEPQDAYGNRGAGWADFFQKGPMQGGWSQEWALGSPEPGSLAAMLAGEQDGPVPVNWVKMSLSVSLCE